MYVHEYFRDGVSIGWRPGTCPVPRQKRAKRAKIPPGIKTAYFVDISCSMREDVLDFAMDLAMAFPLSYALGDREVHRLDPSLRDDILTGRAERGGTASTLVKNPMYDDLRKILVTDDDVPDSLAVCFDFILKVRDRRSALVLDVMTT